MSRLYERANFTHILVFRLGPRRKLKLATDRWKEDTEWLKYGKSTLPEVNNLKVQLADVSR